MLGEHGLGRALEALAERLPVPVDARRRAPSGCPADLEATAYYIVSEALTNVAKHADATRRRRGPAATATSCAARSPTTAAAAPTRRAAAASLGLRDRAEAAGGTLAVVSPPGRGTVVSAALPLAL